MEHHHYNPVVSGASGGGGRPRRHPADWKNIEDYHLSPESIADPAYLEDIETSMKWMNDEQVQILLDQLKILDQTRLINPNEARMVKQASEARYDELQKDMKSCRGELQFVENRAETLRTELNKLIPAAEKFQRKGDTLKLRNEVQLKSVRDNVRYVEAAAAAVNFQSSPTANRVMSCMIVLAMMTELRNEVQARLKINKRRSIFAIRDDNDKLLSRVDQTEKAIKRGGARLKHYERMLSDKDLQTKRVKEITRAITLEKGRTQELEQLQYKLDVERDELDGMAKEFTELARKTYGFEALQGLQQELEALFLDFSMLRANAANNPASRHLPEKVTEKNMLEAVELCKQLPKLVIRRERARGLLLKNALSNRILEQLMITEPTESERMLIEKLMTEVTIDENAIELMIASDRNNELDVQQLKQEIKRNKNKSRSTNRLLGNSADIGEPTSRSAKGHHRALSKIGSKIPIAKKSSRHWKAKKEQKNASRSKARADKS